METAYRAPPLPEEVWTPAWTALLGNSGPIDVGESKRRFFCGGSGILCIMIEVTGPGYVRIVVNSIPLYM